MFASSPPLPPFLPLLLPPPLLPGLALALALASCGGDSRSDAFARGDRSLDMAVEDLHRVGSIDSAEWDFFTRVTSMAFGDDGRLHILDPSQRRVHLVSETGEHVRSFGTPGEGPGEFRSPVGVQVLADGRIVVAHNGHQAFLLFSPEGACLGSHPYDSGVAMPGPRLQRQGGGRDGPVETGLGR